MIIDAYYSFHLISNLQIHFVSYNTKYNNISTALGHSDGLAVLGVFLEVCKSKTLTLNLTEKKTIIIFNS